MYVFIYTYYICIYIYIYIYMYTCIHTYECLNFLQVPACACLRVGVYDGRGVSACD